MQGSASVLGNKFSSERFHSARFHTRDRFSIRRRSAQSPVSRSRSGTKPTIFLSGPSARTSTGLPRTIGHFRVGEQIGRGGMADVVMGVDTRTGEKVALKVVRQLHHGPNLDAEADALRKLAKIPAVVGIIYSNPDAVTPYIAMQYIQGKTIRAVLAEKGRLSLPEALDILTQICVGLEAIHREKDDAGNGRIHGDLKPGNVMLTDNGQIKLLDFGIGGLVGSGLHNPGSIYGTPAYMAPEVCQGKSPSMASDIYSLGIIFYEMLVSTQPFIANNISQTDLRIQDQLNQQISTALPVMPANVLPLPLRPLNAMAVNIMDRMTQKNPAARYQSYAGLIYDLRLLQSCVNFLEETAAA